MDAEPAPSASADSILMVMEQVSLAHLHTPGNDALAHSNVPVAQADVPRASLATVHDTGPQASIKRSDGDLHTARTDSMSSISSANSTSSIEAVPFRAPPRGNVRNSQEMAPPVCVRVPAVHASLPWQASASGSDVPPISSPPPITPILDAEDSTPVTPMPHRSSESSKTESLVRPPPCVSPGPVAKHRMPPKYPSSRWMYRNGPGVSRRLPMLGPTVDDDTRRFMSRPSSRNSLGVLDAASQRSSGSYTHSKAHEPMAPPIVQVDEDARSLRSSSSVATLAPRQDQTSVEWYASQLRDMSPRSRTLHWLNNVRQHDGLPFEESPDRPRASDDARSLLFRHSNLSSSLTLTPRSPSPRMPASETSSLLMDTPPSRPMPLHASDVPNRSVSATPVTVASSQGAADSTRPTRRRTTSDFVFGEVLGEGSYSTVLKAWDVHDWPDAERHALAARANALSATAGQAGSIPQTEHMPKAYAVKVLDKVHILKEKKQKYVRVEKEALSLLVNTPGVVTLYHTFQDRESLYFVLELAENCELLHYVQKYGALDIDSATFYAAQLADAIDRIHRAGVVHRDIKPENVLLDKNMRVMVTDFGSARILARPPDGPSDERAYSFVGTAEYVSPELLNDQVVGMPADWWAFGCVFYQIIAGHSPFRAINEYQTFQKILHRSFTYPPSFPADARTLIDALLCLDPKTRASAKDVKRHTMFHSIDFATLWMVQPPKIQPNQMQRSRVDGQQRVMEELDKLMNDLSFQREDSFASQEPSIATDDSSVTSSCDHSKKTVPPSRSASGSSRGRKSYAWNDILLPNEDVALASPMLLRRAANTGMFARKCKLVLTTRPRLLCLKETTRSPEVLVDIPLHPPGEATNDAPKSVPHLVRSDSRRSAQSQSRSQGAPSLKAPMQAITRTLGLRHKDDDPNDQTTSPDAAPTPDEASDVWPVHVDARGSRGFVVHTPVRQWQFEDPAGDASFWVQNILEVLQSRMT